MQGKANRRASGDHAVIGEHAPAEGTIMRILLAVDGSDYTNRMLSYLTKHKDWSNAGHAFTVFHVMPPVASAQSTSAISSDESRAANHRRVAYVEDSERSTWSAS